MSHLLVRSLSRFVLAFAALGIAAGSLAQDASMRSRLVVPFAPGAATDTLARMLAVRMAGDLKQPVVVENVPGAGGSIGAAQVARAAADGHTMLLSTGTLLSTWAFNKATPYEPLRDFQALGEVARVPLILVASTNAPFSDFAQMRDYAKANPGRLSYATPGIGTPVHIFSAYLFKLLGIDVVHVPYKGGSQQKADLISGQISMSFESPVATLPLLKSKQLQAILASRPVAAAPEIPTPAQVGLSGFEPSVWYGIVMPAGVPAEAASRLEESLARAVGSAEVQSWMAGQGAIPSVVSASAFQATMQADAEFWKRMIVDANVKAE